MPHTAPSANTTALGLLRIALAFIATVASLFLLVRLGPSLPYGKTLLVLAGLAGATVLCTSFLRLARDLSRPVRTPQRQRIGH